VSYYGTSANSNSHLGRPVNKIINLFSYHTTPAHVNKIIMWAGHIMLGWGWSSGNVSCVPGATIIFNVSFLTQRCYTVVPFVSP
jgi:hypothetical protein